MLRFIIFLALASLAIGCVREFPDDQLTTAGNEIRFIPDTYDIMVTRSDDSPVAKEQQRIFLGMLDSDSLFINISEKDRGVSTKSESEVSIPSSFYLTAFNVTDIETTRYIDELELTKSGDDWSDYSPKVYWPTKSNHVHFFAHTHSTGDESPTYTIGDSFSAEFNYLTPKASDASGNDAAVQPDICFAIAPTSVKSDSPVSLKFTHVLSAVNFQLGDLGDADDNGAASLRVTLQDIRSSGTCTITYDSENSNISDNAKVSVDWVRNDATDSYSQNFSDGETFMLIPQTLTDIPFTAYISVGGKTHEFPLTLSGTWNPNKLYTYTITSAGRVDTTIGDIENTEIQQTYTMPAITNTGWTTSYIRVAIIGYWSKTEEETERIVGTWNLNNTSDVTVSPNFNIGSGNNQWTLKSDGFYYYNSPLAPADVATPLFETFRLNRLVGPIANSELKLSVAVQSVADNSVWNTSSVDQN